MGINWKELSVEFVHLNRVEFLLNGTATDRIRPGDGVRIEFEEDLVIVTDSNAPNKVVIFPVTAVSAIALKKPETSEEQAREKAPPSDMPQFSKHSASRPARTVR